MKDNYVLHQIIERGRALLVGLELAFLVAV